MYSCTNVPRDLWAVFCYSDIEIAHWSPWVLIASFKVSAGYTHSCCLTTEGELYTWGNNQDGCLGHAPILKFVDHPKVPDRKICFFNLFGTE